MDERLWATIRSLREFDELSRRSIARELGVSRETVDAALASDRCPKRVSPERPSMLDPYEDALGGILEKYPKLSGVRIFEKLRDLGYPGKLTILRNRLRQIRPRRAPEAFLKRETLPGEEAQADWGSCGSILYHGAIRPLSVFVMALSFSRLLYIEFTVSQEMEDFLRCHVNAFASFGGTPRVILYDNLKSVVRWRQGRLTRFNARFAEFAGTFPFEARPCNPGKGNEKPRAETGVRYVKQNFLAGREFRDLIELRLAARHWLDDVANVRFHRTTGERPRDRFEREHERLRPLPPTPYDTRIIRDVYVTHQARVAFQSNTYSVPPAFVGTTVVLKAAPERVFVYDKDREIASHVRSYGRYRDIEEPAHARAILATKQRGHLDKERDRFLALGSIAAAFLDGLARRGHTTPAFHIQKILHLVDDYGATEVLGALERATRFGAFGADYVQNILVQRTSDEPGASRRRPLSLTGRPDLAEQTVEEPDLTDYHSLTNLEDKDDETDPDR